MNEPNNTPNLSYYLHNTIMDIDVIDNENSDKILILLVFFSF